MLNHRVVLEDVAGCLCDAGPDALLAVVVLRAQRVREIELSHGYAAGAALADAMHASLRTALRPGDRVHRIASHDFLVLLPALRGRAHAALGAGKCVRALQTPFDIGRGAMVQISVAAGIAVAPFDSNEADLLCRRADAACDAAVSQPERHAYWAPPAIPLETLHDDLRVAIGDNGLELHLQPIAALPGRSVRSYEALSRWIHPQFGPIPPDVFIATAERGGLIGALTRWNLNAALRHLVALRADGASIRMAVNLSVDALQLPGFVEETLDLLRLWRVPGDALVLEITESALMRDVERCMHRLTQLRAAGVRIAIDDFGTGYSSLAYLRRLPVDALKIDRSFICDMADDPRSRRIVGTMIELAHDLDMAVVAEGVEDEATLALLQQAGCDFVQGYLVGRPVEAGRVPGVAGR